MSKIIVSKEMTDDIELITEAIEWIRLPVKYNCNDCDREIREEDDHHGWCRNAPYRERMDPRLHFS